MKNTSTGDRRDPVKVSRESAQALIEEGWRLKEETSLRIRALFDKNDWLYPKASLRLDIGFAVAGWRRRSGLIDILGPYRQHRAGNAGLDLKKLLFINDLR